MPFQLRNLQEYREAYQKSIDSSESFWAEIASEFVWEKKWDKVLEYDFQIADTKWFIGGKVNITVNCLDRHLDSKGDQVALLWEPNEPGNESRSYTYTQLFEEVCRVANGLKSIGVTKGDRICFYMPMVPELALGILACARIGAIHNVVFAGFSAQALSDRIKDSGCRVILCADYNSRGPKMSALKMIVDEAIAMDCKSVEKVIVLRNTGGGVSWINDRDLWWEELVKD
ncbi:MAG: AMP-binding protein, partial [Saprospiraceae bacterium]